MAMHIETRRLSSHKAHNEISSAAAARWFSVAAVAVGALIGACTSTQPAQSQMAVSKNAVEHATDQAGTEAPSQVNEARLKLERARTAYAKKDYVAARQLGEQAQADAELAEAQSRSVRADRALTEVKDGIKQLREEINRNAPAQ